MYLRDQDGLHREYGRTGNRFPRTMQEAFGGREHLHVPEDTTPAGFDTLLYYARSALLLLALLVLLLLTAVVTA